MKGRNNFMMNLPELTDEKKSRLDDIIKYLEEKRIGYINVPTGWGKTFLSKHLIKHYLENDKTILFITSQNKQLLKQIYYKDDTIQQDLLFPNSICISSDFKKSPWNKSVEKYIPENNVKMIFASLQTLLKREKLREFLIGSIDLVIIDEIHNFIHNNGSKLINQFEKNSECKIFGMTATPYQGVIDKMKFVHEISQNMDEIFSKDMPECILEKQLSPLQYFIIRNNENIEEIFDLGEKLMVLENGNLFLNGKHLDKIIIRTQLAKQIYQEKIFKNNPKAKTLIFCSPIKNISQKIDDSKKKITSFHAKLCAGIFNNEIEEKINAGYKFQNKTTSNQWKHAVYLSSELNDKEKEEILKSFKNPNTPPFVLCTVGMLIEGFDFPLLKNLILLRPTLSLRLFEQQIGRVVRTHKEKLTGNIYEVIERIDIESLYQKFEDSILSIKKYKNLLMLNPEHRLETIFLQNLKSKEFIDKNLLKVNNWAVESIDVKSLDLHKKKYQFKESVLELPPIKFRAKFINSYVQKIDKKIDGKFSKEHFLLIDLISKFKFLSIHDIEEILPLLKEFDNLEKKTQKVKDLSIAATKNKPIMYNDLKWFLKLKILNYLEIVKNVSEEELKRILNRLEFENLDKDIKILKLLCIQKSSIQDKDEFLSNFSKNITTIIGQDIVRSKKKVAKIEFIWGKTYFYEKFAQDKDMRSDAQIMEKIFNEEFGKIF